MSSRAETQSDQLSCPSFRNAMLQRARQRNLPLGIWRVVLAVVFLVASAGSLLAQSSNQTGDWVHWRGPELNGVSRDVGVATKWSP